MERVLEVDTKEKFTWQVNLIGSCKVANITIVMATMTVYIFPLYAYCDQR